MKPELSRKLDEELRVKQKKERDMCDHPVNRLHGLSGVYYCDKCRTSFNFDNSDHPKQSVTDERMNYMRNQALSVIELTKGFTTEPTDNAMKTLLEFTDYILELTNGQIPNK